VAFPPGHIPGFHLPGSLIPIGVVLAQQEADMAHKRRTVLLLLLGSSNSMCNPLEPEFDTEVDA
jgi:hypothetical protein